MKFELADYDWWRRKMYWRKKPIENEKLCKEVETNFGRRNKKKFWICSKQTHLLAIFHGYSSKSYTNTSKQSNACLLFCSRFHLRDSIHLNSTINTIRRQCDERETASHRTVARRLLLLLCVLFFDTVFFCLLFRRQSSEKSAYEFDTVWFALLLIMNGLTWIFSNSKLQFDTFQSVSNQKKSTTKNKR